MADPERHRSGAADSHGYWPVCALSPVFQMQHCFHGCAGMLAYACFLTLSRYAFIFLGLYGPVHCPLNLSSIQWIVAAVSVGVGFGL